jgi:RimJ/RimL family protein N-acetyltransferase
VATEAAGQAKVRPAARRDLDALVSISLACHRARRPWAGRAWPAPAAVAERTLWWERLRDAGTWVGVAEAGLTMIGCASFWPAREGDDPRLAYFAGPLVDPEWWGEGIGAALHRAAVGALELRGFRHVEQVVEAGDRRTRGFLEHEGWRRLDDDPQRSTMTLLRYARTVHSVREAA